MGGTGGYGRHGRLPPKVFLKKEKFKFFGGKPPAPPIASHLLYRMADLGLNGRFRSEDFLTVFKYKLECSRFAVFYT